MRHAIRLVWRGFSLFGGLTRFGEVAQRAVSDSQIGFVSEEEFCRPRFLLERMTRKDEDNGKNKIQGSFGCVAHEVP
jgi:hypothetical protein